MTTPRRRLPGLLLTLAAIALAGCTATPADAPDPQAAMDRLRGDWTLAAIDTRPLGATANAPTLTLVEGPRVVGHAGVNRYSAALDESALADGRFLLGPAIATRMAGPPEAMAMETEFLTALERVATFDRDALDTGTLRLLDADGREVLRFRSGE